MARHRQQFQQNQLNLDFEQVALPAASMSPEHAAIVHAHLPPPVLPPIKTREPEQPRLPAWDFRDQFPAPLDEAVFAGIFNDEDLDFEQVQAIHVERANELLVAYRISNDG